jgi:hypothetical protein
MVWFAALYFQQFFSNTRISMLLCVIVSTYCLFIDVFSSGGRVCLSVCEDFGGCVLLLVCCPAPVRCVGPAWLC